MQQSIRKLWVDSGYRGEAIRTWVAKQKKTHKIDLEVVAKQGCRFTLLKRRWVIERTLAWLMNFRRHARDYEELTRHSETLIHIAMIHLLLKRIKKKNVVFRRLLSRYIKRKNKKAVLASENGHLEQKRVPV